MEYLVTTLRPDMASSRGSSARPPSCGSRRSRTSSIPSSRASRSSSQVVGPMARQFAVSGLPGYAGYIPGKVAKNVHGSTFQVANERATQEVDLARTGGRPMRSTRTFGPAPGMGIPGYMGFVPGRYADNVIGQTSARGAETAWCMKEFQMDERQQRVQAYRRGERPPTGSLDHAGYRSLGSSIGIDSRCMG
mmetsp:Transcript_77710/g.173942  ORF Transcript_77710/g.173942 Transcript_77710/m.173942 type:complete len:192 (-) Transcript_77710:60-635(-)